MKSSQKIALAILLSILLSTLFTILAFTSLFSLIEVELYYPIIAREIEKNVSEYRQYISEYHRDNIENKFALVLKKDYMWKAYDVNQKDDDIVKRKETFEELDKSFPKQIFVRLLGTEGKKIHFSTLESDINIQTEPTKISYKDLNKADPLSDKFNLVTKAGEEPRVITDYLLNRFIYSFPVVDSFNDYLGTALFYLPIDNLKIFLLSKMTGIVMKEMKIITADGILIDPAGLSIYAGQQELEMLKVELENLWKRENNTHISSSILATTLQNQEVRIFFAESEFVHLGLIVPLSQFAMSSTHKIIILTIFIFTTLLIIFLIFNLKQDPQRIVSERMRKFQLEFLKEFIRNKEEIDIDHWQHEIEIRRAEIKKYMKKGLAKLSKGKEDQLDNYIMNSWDEIVSFLKTKLSRPKEERIELTRIEELIKQALAQGKIILPTRTIEEKASAVTVLSKAPEAKEEAEEAEEVEELEEVGEQEEAKEAKALEELEKAKEVGELEEAKEVEVLEEFEEAEELEELEEAEVGEPAEKEKVRVAAKDEEIEELEAFPEISPLRPLPYEQLEELPLSSAETTKEQEEQDIFQFKELIKDNKVICYTIKETMELYEQSKTNVIFDEGVYRVKEELYDKKEKKLKHRGLKALAESIIAASKNKEEKEVIGIDHLIKIDETFPGFGIEEEGREIPLKKIFPILRQRMPFTNQGLDIDGYFKQYTRQISGKTSIQGFGELLKKLKAVCAAILTMEENIYRIGLAIGMDDYTKNNFSFSKDSLFAINYLEESKVILIKEKVLDIYIFNNKISSFDKRYIKYAVLIPAIFNNKKAYLFVGFPSQKEKELIEILQAMNVYLK